MYKLFVFVQEVVHKIKEQFRGALDEYATSPLAAQAKVSFWLLLVNDFHVLIVFTIHFKITETAILIFKVVSRYACLFNLLFSLTSECFWFLPTTTCMILVFLLR